MQCHASSRRLSAASLTYNGEVIADTVVPVVAQVAGQIQEVKVKVGDDVRKGDLLVRIDSSVLEAQHDQALAALDAGAGPARSGQDAGQAQRRRSSRGRD